MTIRAGSGVSPMASFPKPDRHGQPAYPVTGTRDPRMSRRHKFLPRALRNDLVLS